MMLNNTTMLFVVMTIFVVLPLVVWLTLYNHHNHAVRFWCAGGLLASLGLLLMAVRSHVPVWLTYHMANACLIFVFVLWAQGMRVMRRVGLPWWGLLFLFAAGLLYYSSLYAWAPSNMRGVGMRVLLAVMAAWVAWESWLAARQLKTANAYPISGAMAVLSAVMLVQVLLTGGGGSVPSPFSNTWNASALAAAALLTAMVTHFSFVGMTIDLALRKELKERSEAMSLQHAGLLDTQLMDIERQRRMMLVSGAMAHELNQPLTVALTNAQLMQRLVASGKMVSDTLAELLQKMTLGVERAASILHRIREIQPHTDNVLQPETLDLAELANQALEHLKHDVHKQSINVRIVNPEEPLWCYVDALSTSQVLVNLLRNAIQAMDSQTEKTMLINCQGTADRVWVEIADTGPGLPKHIEAQWGQAFLTTREEGLGLGLSISRTLVQQMGGVLELRNRHQAFGAVATLSFDRAPAPVGLPELAEEPQP
jgi:signal transduction histidine kinase